jgi:hypothetical protein
VTDVLLTNSEQVSDDWGAPRITPGGATTSAADWIVASDLPWQRLVTFGPAGFGAYARVRLIPDPIRDGQQESETDPHASPDEVDQWRALLKLLAAATEDPDHCYFGLWEGWGFPESVRLWPSFGVPGGARPPARSYFLFRGSLSEAGIWGGGHARERRDLGPFGVLGRRRARVRVAV